MSKAIDVKGQMVPKWPKDYNLYNTEPPHKKLPQLKIYRLPVEGRINSHNLASKSTNGKMKTDPRSKTPNFNPQQQERQGTTRHRANGRNATEHTSHGSKRKDNDHHQCMLVDRRFRAFRREKRYLYRQLRREKQTRASMERGRARSRK